MKNVFKKMLLVVLLGLSFQAHADEGEVALLTYLELKPGTYDKFMSAFVDIVKPSRAEPGNIAWYVQRGVDDPNSIVFYTRWKNEAALQWHLKSPPLVKYIAETAPLLEPGYPKFTRLEPIDSAERKCVLWETIWGTNSDNDGKVYCARYAIIQNGSKE